MAGGRRVGPPAALAAARERFEADLAWLPERARALREPEPVAVRLTDRLDRLGRVGAVRTATGRAARPGAARRAGPGRSDPGRATTEAAAFVMLVVLFTVITVYGGQVLTGVVEEKSTRVVELLLARMPPWQLLVGKILGIGLLALGQLLMVLAAASASAAAVDAVNVPRIGSGLVAWLLVWFGVGFALWSVVYGGLGALASRSEDAQTVSAPATVVLLAAYFFAMFAALSDSDALTTRIASLVPVTAPLVMPIRLVRGQIAPWETTLALMLAIAAIYALVRLAGRVYAGALLRTGAKVRLRDAGEPAAPAHPADAGRRAAGGQRLWCSPWVRSPARCRYGGHRPRTRAWPRPRRGRRPPTDP
jgi:ABC-type Na+ efflux pump permease subunit